MAGNVSDDNTAVISQSDESLNTVSKHLDNESPAEKTPAP
ncbi:hypothetical protein A2U01_0112908, partial [Trifolium medium]|nr:hypothetical protein [Trifolium medium]